MYSQWPDQDLLNGFQGLKLHLDCRFQEGYRAGLPPAESLSSAFRSVCDDLVSGVSRDYLRHVKECRKGDWLQEVGSTLGMILHFQPGRTGACLINVRRPGCAFTTYPSSPAATRLVARMALRGLLSGLTAQDLRFTGSDPEAYLRRALAFRVIDPSMESGQLLLELATQTIAIIRRANRRSGANCDELARMTLKWLVTNCLYGIDRNPLAPLAVQTAFRLLAFEYGDVPLEMANLLVADSLRDLPGGLPAMDAVVNNPPWEIPSDPEERSYLRKHFQVFGLLNDVYAAFVERSMDLLKPGGTYAAMLPAQFVGGERGRGLRELFANRLILKQIVVFPRHVFSRATVRSVGIFGRKAETGGGLCKLAIYPGEKRLDQCRPPIRRRVKSEELVHASREGWLPLFYLGSARRDEGWTRLGDVASVYVGAQVYGVGRGSPKQTALTLSEKHFISPIPSDTSLPAVRGRDVGAYRQRKPILHLDFGSWLARPGSHGSLQSLPRIYLREICRRDGTMTACCALPRSVPLHGVLTVVPKRANLAVLLAFLNSSAMANWVRASVASFLKVDFQRITLAEVRSLPLPADVDESRDGPRQGLVSEIAMLASQAAAEDVSDFERIRMEIDRAVDELYGSAHEQLRSIGS